MFLKVVILGGINKMMVIFNDIKMMLWKYLRFECFIFVKLYLYGIIKKIDKFIEFVLLMI